MNHYQETIHGLDPTVNPAGVEASMRLQFGTLDHLDTREFRREIKIAKECEAYQPGHLKSAAESFGLAEDFARWEERLAAPALAPTPPTPPPTLGVPYKSSDFPKNQREFAALLKANRPTAAKEISHEQIKVFLDGPRNCYMRYTRAAVRLLATYGVEVH